MDNAALNLKSIRVPVLVAAAIGFLYWGVLAKLGRDWWNDENYSHGLLVPFVIAFFLWTERGTLGRAVGAPRMLAGLAIMAAALAMLLAGTLGAELFTRRVSLAVMLLGVVVYFFGPRLVRLLAVPFVLLLLAIPIPQIIFNKIAFPLQIWASQVAVWGIRLFEVPTIRKGNVFEILPTGATQVVALEVVEACSGIRSLMTLVTLALLLGYFTRDEEPDAGGSWKGSLASRDLWRTAILMVSAVPIAVLTNAARVTATGVMTYHYGRRATEGTVHDVSGWLVYVVALLMLFGLNEVLRRMFRARSAPAGDVSPARSEYAPVSGRALTAVLALIVAGGLFINWFETRGESVVSRRPLAEMPAALGDWRQKGDEIRFGPATESVLRVSDYSMREYQLPDGRLANVYVGYYASQRTGATYHSPQNCLPGAGWVMKEPELVEIPDGSGGTFAANRYIIENGVYREVMIYWYQGRGRTEASEYRDKINTVWDSVTRRRSDGAMIRVMTSAGADVEAATRAAVDLSGQLSSRLGEFVPE